MLDNLKNTSNDLYYLKAVALQYRGDAHYQNEMAVTDKNLITTKGVSLRLSLRAKFLSQPDYIPMTGLKSDFNYKKTESGVNKS